MFEKMKLQEYDIKSANANVMYTLNMIDKDLYEKLINMDKKERVIYVGKMIKKDDTLYNELMDGYKYYTDKFIKENGLEDNVYEVVKDAVWIFGKYPKKTEFNNYVKFTRDRVATSVMTLDKIKFYYNSINNKLFNRGLGDIDFDTFPILKKIKEFMMYKESDKYKILYKKIHKFHYNYITENVDESYRYNIRRKKDDIRHEDPMDDYNYKLIRLMIKYLL